MKVVIKIVELLEISSVVVVEKYILNWKITSVIFDLSNLLATLWWLLLIDYPVNRCYGK